MQSKQYDLCLEVLRRLQVSGVLPKLVLVGSWCLVLYRQYFSGTGTVPAIRTRDIDFLVPSESKLVGKTDIPALLNDLGFITGFRGEQGAMVLEHPELMIEFLVPEKGRSDSRLRNLPELGVNAIPLRFMSVATMMTIRLSLGDVPVTVPHPAAFALHKLLVAPRRTKPDKKRKDLDAALMVLDLLGKKGEIPVVRALLAKFPASWKKSILSTLTEDRRDDLRLLLVGTQEA